MQRLKAFQTSIRNVEAPQSKQTLKTIQDGKPHPSDIPGANSRPQDRRAIAQMGAGGKALLRPPPSYTGGGARRAEGASWPFATAQTTIIGKLKKSIKT